MRSIQLTLLLTAFAGLFTVAAADEPALGEDDVAPAVAPEARPARARKSAAARPKKSTGKPRARSGSRKTARTRRKAAVAAADTAQG